MSFQWEYEERAEGLLYDNQQLEAENGNLKAENHDIQGELKLRIAYCNVLKSLLEEWRSPVAFMGSGGLVEYLDGLEERTAAALGEKHAV